MAVGRRMAFTIALVILAARFASTADVRRKVPLIGVVAALMIVAMSSEIVPIAYHINLSVIGGVLLGPRLSVIASFIVVSLLAMLGHGGITVIGLNTVVIGAEMVIGWALFRALVRAFGRGRAAPVAGLATVVTLAITTTLVVGIVALAGAGEAAERKTGALDPATMRFENPFAEGLFALELQGHAHEHDEEHAEDADHAAEELALSPARFASIVYVLGPFGWALEALVTAFVIGYVARVRPVTVFEGALAEKSRRIPGDESGGH